MINFRKYFAGFLLLTTFGAFFSLFTGDISVTVFIMLTALCAYHVRVAFVQHTSNLVSGTNA